MGKKPTSRLETNTERASRVRDNKRRHRARQKEYILDLERRVAETREQGVQVTKEVQIAAQKVTGENAKLRDLLKRTGYTDDAISAWVKEDRCLNGTESYRLVFESMSKKSVQQVTSACESQRRRKPEARNVSAKVGQLVLAQTPENEECLTKASLPVESRNKKSEVSLTQVSATICTKSFSSPQYADSMGAPCKLLTLLAKNPAADITQMPLSTESDNQPYKISEPKACSSDGIECSTAYKMLMQYATSEGKVDKIAAALESGCTPSATGGCKVKKSVVWMVLDDECT